MKVTNFCSMLFMSSFAAGYLVPRQEGLSGYGDLLNALQYTTNVLPKVKAVKKQTLTPAIAGNDVKRQLLSYGPYKIGVGKNTKKAGNFVTFDPQGTAWANIVSDFPTDITVLSALMKVTLEDGSEISNSKGIYNHHAFVFDISKGMESNLQCRGSNDAIAPLNTIAASASDTGTPEVSFASNFTARPHSGNYVPKGHKMLITCDLVNYNDVAQNVYLNVDMQYVEGRAPETLDSLIHLVSAGSCASKQHGMDALMLEPPKDRKQFTITDNDIEVKQDGVLLYTKGHLHDGGVNMVFQLNGKEICNSKAEYNAGIVGEAKPMSGHAGGHGGGGMLSGMSDCPLGIEIKKGDRISVEAFYDLDKHPARVHAAGGMAESMALAAIVVGNK